MLSQKLLLAALAATTSAIALPNTLTKRDDIVSDPWGDGKGNIKLVFGQGTVDLGDVTIEALFDKIRPICHESGQCEQNDIDTKGWWMQGGLDGDQEPITVTLKPSGAYPTWIRNGLVDILYAAVVEVADCRDVTDVDSSVVGGQRTTARQCLVPKYWGINYQADGDAAPPNIGIAVTSRDDKDASICKDAMGAVGALAGVVSGAAGAVFSLLTLTCQA